MQIKLLVIFPLLISLGFTVQAQKMNNQSLDKIIHSVADKGKIEGQLGAWQFEFNERLLICLTDETHNRMRIISPIIEEKELTETQMKHSLIANFHTALDIKYAISDGVLWSCYIHPLKELSTGQVKDAIKTGIRWCRHIWYDLQ